MDTETDVSTEEQTEEQSATETSTPADETGYTRDKQMLDQERANARRARDELATVSDAYEQATSKIAQLEQEMKTLQKAEQKEQDKLDEMDPDYVDKKVISNIQRLQAQLEAKAAQLNEVSQKIAAYEQKLAADEEQRQTEARKLAVLETVEEFLSDPKMPGSIPGVVKYRNEASKLADDLVDSGQAKHPQTIKEAVALMRRCYLEVKSKKEKPKDKSVSVDTGKAGVTAPAKPSGIKPGRLDEVAAQMLEDQSWKSD